MDRKYIDCRAYPSESHCSIMISADGDEELLEAAVQHAIAVHGEHDTPGLREALRGMIRTLPAPLAKAA